MADNDLKRFHVSGANSERNHFETDEDPLVELARIVSEDGGFYPSKSAGRQQPDNSVQDSDDFSADLEAELLQELELSLQARQRAAEPPPAPIAAQAPQVEPEPDYSAEPVQEEGGRAAYDAPAAQHGDAYDPTDLLRSLQEQLGGFGHELAPERDDPARDQGQYTGPVGYHFEETWQRGSADAPAAGDYVEAEYRDDDQDEYPTAGEHEAHEEPAEEEHRPDLPVPVQPRALTEWGRAVPSLDRWPEATRAAEPEPAPEEMAPDFFDFPDDDEPVAPVPERAARTEPHWPDRPVHALAEEPQQDDDPAFGAAAAAGAAAWSALPSADRTPRVRPVTADDWLTGERDVRKDLRNTIADFNAGTERAPEAQQVEAADFHAEMERQLAADLDADWAPEPFGSEADDDDRAPPAALAAGPGSRIAGDGARQSSGRGRRTALMAASVLGVVVIGGAIAAYLQSGSDAPSGPPPVIKAEEGAVKVEAQPEQQAAKAGEGAIVFNRPADAPAEEQLIDSAEEPREVARVVLPPEPQSNELLTRPVNGSTPPADPGTGETVPMQNGTVSPIGPRKVRTMVVRPDGTIVAGTEGEAAAPAAAQPPQAAAAEPQPVPNADPLRSDEVETEIAGLMEGQPADLPGLLNGDEGQPDIVPPPAGQALDTQAPPADLANQQPAAPMAAGMPRPRPQPPAGLQRQAALQQQAPAPTAAPQPVDLLAGSAQQQAPAPQVAAAPVAPAPAPTAGAGGHVVQLTSQRTEAAARQSFEALKRRYPGVLGQYQPDIQQADLGAKGIYYRARVGPWATRAEAIQVCEALKAAGGSCFVTQ